MTDIQRTDRIVEIMGELCTIRCEIQKQVRFYQRQIHVVTGRACQRRGAISLNIKVLKRQEAKLMREFDKLTECPTFLN